MKTPDQVIPNTTSEKKAKITGTLWRLTQNEFDKLPVGTKLVDILGNEIEIGKNEIDLDTRDGFLSFGFLEQNKPKDISLYGAGIVELVSKPEEGGEEAVFIKDGWQRPSTEGRTLTYDLENFSKSGSGIVTVIVDKQNKYWLKAGDQEAPVSVSIKERIIYEKKVVAGEREFGKEKKDWEEKFRGGPEDKPRFIV